MTRRGVLRVTMSARAAVAIGQPFVPRDVSFSDPGVALDEISTMRAGAEPLVLRVEASGGNSAERKAVTGDWLCDSDGSAPRRVPATRWRQGNDAAAWARERSWVGAWESCQNAMWMFHAAGHAGVAGRQLALAACACARTALRFVPDGERRPRLAIEAVEKWARGGDAGMIDFYTHLMWRAAGRGLSPEPGAEAASAVFYLCSNASAFASGYVPSRGRGGFFVRVADDASSAAFLAWPATAPAVARSMADMVRAEVPTLSVLRALLRT